MSDNTFAPLKEVTRAEFITMIVRAFDLLDVKSSAAFSDVKASDWSYGYIASGVKNGLINGVGNGKFDPNRAITREEMAIIVSNTLKKFKGKSVSDTNAALANFKDQATIAAYGKEAVALLTQEGIVQGLTAETFGPKNIANRAQAAVIIDRMLKLN